MLELKGLIISKGYTLGSFSKAMGYKSEATMSYKMQDGSRWTMDEFAMACDLLDMTPAEGLPFFLSEKLEISNLTGGGT